MKKLTILLSLLSLGTLAQNPVPGKAQTRPIALTGGTIHVGNGQVIQNGVLVFDKGLIRTVGPAGTAFDRNGTEVIDVTGQHVYPGLISAANAVGLEEIASVAATSDKNETGELNPSVRALVAYSTDSEIIPTIRGNGLLIGQAMPQGGTVSGISSVFQYDGWNWEDAVLRPDDGIWVNWPSLFSRRFNPETFQPETSRNERRTATLQALEKAIVDARAYAEVPNPTPVNLKLAAMKGLFDGSKNLYLRVDAAREILEAVRFAQTQQVKKIVVVGGEEAYLVTDFLKANSIPVILSATHNLPRRDDDDVDLPYRMPSLLHKAGIQAAISYNGLSWRTRNLPFLAGTAAGFGLDKEVALQMITLNPAQILGIADRVGSLETGKHATLVVSKGDILDMRTNQVTKAWIQGRAVDLDDKQKRLYRKFSEKYTK
jgi:imidazolonepropionase-like amidohydrolase